MFFGVVVGLGLLGMLLGLLALSPIISSFGPRGDPRARTMGIAFGLFLTFLNGMALAVAFGSTTSGLTSMSLAFYRFLIVLSGIPDSEITITSPLLVWVARLLLLPTVISAAYGVHASRQAWATRGRTGESRGEG